MIDIHVLVPKKELDTVKIMEGDDFIIVSFVTSYNKNTSFIRVLTTEEVMVFLSIKYGQQNVWKR